MSPVPPSTSPARPLGRVPEDAQQPASLCLGCGVTSPFPFQALATKKELISCRPADGGVCFWHSERSGQLFCSYFAPHQGVVPGRAPRFPPSQGWVTRAARASETPGETEAVSQDLLPHALAWRDVNDFNHTDK